MFRGDFISHLQPPHFESGYELSDVFNMVLNDQFEYQSTNFRDSAMKSFTSSSDDDLDSPPSSPFDENKLRTFIKQEPKENGKLNSPLALTRDDLLKFSSETLENLAQTLASARSLTEEERKQLKKQKRLIKNRESAQLSRQRKKYYLEELEKKISILTGENHNLTRRLGLLEEENKTLREESLQLKNLLHSSPQLSSALTCTSVPPPTTRKTVHKEIKKQVNMKTAGVYLLIVLLSFGLFFNLKKDSISQHQRIEQMGAKEQQQEEAKSTPKNKEMADEKQLSHQVETSSKKRKKMEEEAQSEQQPPTTQAQVQAQLQTEQIAHLFSHSEIDREENGDLFFEETGVIEDNFLDTNMMMRFSSTLLDPSVLSLTISPNVASGGDFDLELDSNVNRNHTTNLSVE
eukprot:TRINITY_DN3755_c0_g1_i1.p1 TRINITY_DN3755_c0_g1~~TRINITY_DN3755_c0_g1_i1.p1  ORF type:complete len:443 (-),score=138.98 TRINITY_DN3755_c0_g1_i1:243-1454(-)